MKGRLAWGRLEACRHGSIVPVDADGADHDWPPVLNEQEQRVGERAEDGGSLLCLTDQEIRVACAIQNVTSLTTARGHVLSEIFEGSDKVVAAK